VKRSPWLLASLLACGLAATAAACTTADAPPAEEAAPTAAGGEEAAPTTAAEAPDAAMDNPALKDLGTEANPILMSFTPSGKQENVSTGSEQVVKLLAEATGLKITGSVASSYGAVVEAMGAGNAHAAWLPTFSYILAHEKYEVEPLLAVSRFGKTTYASLLITKKDGGITDIAGLKGKKFCRPDAESTSGWIVPSITLKAAGVDPQADLTVVDLGTHDAVVTGVYNGDCDAGAVFDDARANVEKDLPDVKDVVAVMATSDAIPNDNLSVVKGFPKDISDKLIAGLQQVLTTEEGKAALKTLYSVEDLEPIGDDFYDGFRATLSKAGINAAELVTQ